MEFLPSLKESGNTKNLISYEIVDELKNLEHQILSIGDVSRLNSDFYKKVKTEMLSIFKDWRSAHIKKSTKKNIKENLLTVIRRTISYYEEIISNNLKSVEINTLEQQQMQTRKILIDKVFNVKNSYFESFEDKNEAFREWECLISLLESGHITESDLPTYGIHI